MSASRKQDSSLISTEEGAGFPGKFGTAQFSLAFLSEKKIFCNSYENFYIWKLILKCNEIN